VIANHDEVSFGLLRYFLGGYRPSKTARLTMSNSQLHGILLDLQPDTTGISRMSRVNRIFTATTISPSLSLRQCPDRYAIRAGRNLPDKEFRYLRTVIVTAAIHPGLSSVLCSEELTPNFDLWALGRLHTIYFVLMTLHSAVFLINSRLGHFSATPKSF